MGQVDEAAVEAALRAMQEQQNQPKIIPPQPVPMIVSVEQIVLQNGQNACVLSISHPSGISTFFFDPKLAKQVGAEMQRVGSAGALTLAGGA